MSDPIIQTWHLTKVFRKQQRLRDAILHPFVREQVTAVEDVTLTVKRGEVFGLLGPNGAGKTTLIKLLCTLVLPTSGQAIVNGYDLSRETEVKRSIGLVTGEERSFYWRLTGEENLQFYATLNGLSPTLFRACLEELSRLLDLSSFLNRRFDEYSSGMRQRLALARGLLHDPPILFLDEPTRSLDPTTAGQLRDIIRDLAHRHGRTVFLVTHNLDEAEELCDRIGIMHQGRLQAVDHVGCLRDLVQPEEHLRIAVAGLSPEDMNRLRELEGVVSIGEEFSSPEVVTLDIHLRDSTSNLPGLMQTIVGARGAIVGLSTEKVSLERIFQRFTSPDAGFPGTESALAEGEARSEHISEDRDGQAADVIWNQKASPPASTTLITERKAIAVWRKPWAFLRRDFLLQISYRLSFVLQLLGILFAVTSFYYVAQLFGPAAAPHLAAYGGDYFAFVLIGIAFIGYQSVASYSFSSAIRAGQELGTLEAMLVTPTSLATILLSSSLWSFIFTSFRVLIYLFIGAWIFGAKLSQANWLSAIAVQLLNILAFSGIGILSASFVLVFKQGDPLNFVFASLSGLLGGVYYPVGVLPRGLQVVSYLLPLTYTLRAMRGAVLQGQSLMALASDLAILALFSAVVLPLSLLAFHYAVRKAKRDGSLAQY